MSTKKRAQALVIVVSPVADRPGVFEASVDGRVLCISRTPFFAAARKLITEGYDAATAVVMRHSGSDTDCLRAPLGMAAKLTVEDSCSTPDFRRWKPFQGLVDGEKHAPDFPDGSPRIEPIDAEAA
jgi:hypothetical protein